MYICLNSLHRTQNVSMCKKQQEPYFFEESWFRSFAFSQSSLVSGTNKSLAFLLSSLVFDALTNFLARQRRRCSAARA